MKTLKSYVNTVNEAASDVVKDFVVVFVESLNRDFVVLADKLDDFVEDIHAEQGRGQELYVFKATLCFNGSIGRGDYKKAVKI